MTVKQFVIKNTLSALNAVSDELTVRGVHDVSIDVDTGSFVGTVTQQCCYNGDGDWRDVQDFTANAEESPEVGTTQNIRFKVTAYTSGSVEVAAYCGR